MPYVGQTITDVFPTSISVDTATIATANISNQLKIGRASWRERGVTSESYGRVS